MALKTKSVWFCSSCGNESPKWMGRCPACGEWNTMVEEKVVTGAQASRRHEENSIGTSSRPLSLREIDSTEESRTTLQSSEMDRLLGGGIVKGSLVLIAGEPGIGKSTLSLQIPLHCRGLRTLYVTGEESARQVKLRAARLGGDGEDCLIYSETLMENILAEAKKTEPELMIVDSIQTMYTQTMESSPGSVSQIKECASMLLRLAKETGIPVILIGHITKEGSIAGPKVLEHIVDVVLQFEGDNTGAYRLLRSIKNRFGSTSEMAVFEMTGTGLREVLNPSDPVFPDRGAVSGEFGSLRDSAAFGYGIRCPEAEHAAGCPGETCRFQAWREGCLPEHGRRPARVRYGLRPRCHLCSAVFEFRFRDTFRCVLRRRSGPER